MVAVNKKPQSDQLPAKLGHKEADTLMIPRTLEDLRPTYERLRNHFDNLTVHTAVSYHRAGEILLEGCRDPAVNQAFPGPKRAMKAWAEALDMPERILYHCKHVAEQYTADEVRQLVEDRGVSWGHLCHLMAVPDPEERMRLIERVGEEHLTIRQLADEIVPEEKPKPRGPGRSPAVPKNARQGLGRVASAAVAFSRQVREAWFCPVFNLDKELASAPEGEIGEDTADQLGKAIEAFEQIAEDAPTVVARLRKAKERVSDVLIHRDVAAAAAAAAEEGPVDDADDLGGQLDETLPEDDDPDAEPVVAGKLDKEVSDE